MRYQVVFTGDDGLPAGTDWALVTTMGGPTYCLIRGARVTTRVLSEAWAAWMEFQSRSSISP